MTPVPLPLPDRTEQAILSLPDGSGPFPGVVVVHDLTGFRADTRRHCTRLAAEGFAAAAPDLYASGRPRCVVQTVTSLLRGKGRGLELIEATRKALAGHPEVDGSRIGIIGFCMGGGFALLAAADGPYAVAGPFWNVPQAGATRGSAHPCAVRSSGPLVPFARRTAPATSRGTGCDPRGGDP